MGPRRTSPLVLVLLVVVAVAGMTAGAAGAPAESDDDLELYKATVDAGKLQAIQRGGYDVASVRDTAAGAEVELVLTGAERDRLRGQGIQLDVVRDEQGRSQRQRAEV
jgi:hypothetical protein